MPSSTKRGATTDSARKDNNTGKNADDQAKISYLENKIDYQQISQIYESKEKYINEMDSSTIDYQRLLIETVEWKIPNLMVVVPANIRPQTVAEVGCFTGHLIANIFINGQQSFEKYGYDVNQAAIKVARNTYLNVQFSGEDIFESGKKFDLLILSDIIEHIEDDLSFLKKCHSLSANLLVNIPLEKSFSQIGRKYGFDDPSGHLRAYNLRDAQKLIDDSGYNIVNQQTLCFYDSFLDRKRRLLDSHHAATGKAKSIVRKF